MRLQVSTKRPTETISFQSAIEIISHTKKTGLLTLSFGRFRLSSPRSYGFKTKFINNMSELQLGRSQTMMLSIVISVYFTPIWPINANSTSMKFGDGGVSVLVRESKEIMLGDRDATLQGDKASDVSAAISDGISDATFVIPEKHPTEFPMLSPSVDGSKNCHSYSSGQIAPTDFGHFTLKNSQVHIL